MFFYNKAKILNESLFVELSFLGEGFENECSKTLHTTF